MGFDLNRQWNQISTYAHPALHAIKAYLSQLDHHKVSGPP